MKKSPFTLTKACFLFVFLLSASLVSLAQNNSKYKVVCDKTDNTIKVVKTSDKAAKYVTLKTGFPFRQIANQWIIENHPTRSCDDGSQTTNDENRVLTPQNTPAVMPISNPTSPQTALPPTPPAINYRNSSFLFHIKFSNLGEAFKLTNETMSGIEFGYEQLFGHKGYFGTGISTTFYFGSMDTWQNVDSETIYFFSIPAFGGYRIQKRMFVAMFEAGGAVNTKFQGNDAELDAFGLPAESFSVNFLARAKVGFPGVMFELGYDSWLSEVFTDNTFNMSAITVGIRVSF